MGFLFPVYIEQYENLFCINSRTLVARTAGFTARSWWATSSCRRRRTQQRAASVQHSLIHDKVCQRFEKNSTFTGSTCVLHKGEKNRDSFVDFRIMKKNEVLKKIKSISLKPDKSMFVKTFNIILICIPKKFVFLVKFCTFLQTWMYSANWKGG